MPEFERSRADVSFQEYGFQEPGGRGGGGHIGALQKHGAAGAALVGGNAAPPRRARRGNPGWWECDATPDAAGLYFYFFTIDTWRGQLSITRRFGGEGGIDGTGEHWQQTVYQAGFETPDWLSGGVMYQIFPDRFFASGTPKTGVPADRRLHERWGEPPDFLPNQFRLLWRRPCGHCPEARLLTGAGRDLPVPQPHF